jgi:hypothetical protein
MTRQTWLLAPILRYVSGLRFPWLFGLALVVFGIDFLLPDVIPFADELLLGLTTLLLGAWRKEKRPEGAESCAIGETNDMESGR